MVVTLEKGESGFAENMRPIIPLIIQDSFATLPSHSAFCNENPEGKVDTEKYKKEVHDVYMNVYAPGFSNSDIEAIDQTVKYPIAYLRNGTVSMHDSYPIDPQKLRTAKGWDHTSDWDFEVTAANDQEAHAVASSIRRRKDGSIIEHVQAFYAFTKTDQGWKMYAVSDVTFQPNQIK